MTRMERLRRRLRDDLAHEYRAVVRYDQYAGTVTGPYRPQMVHDETGHRDEVRKVLAGRSR